MRNGRMLVGLGMASAYYGYVQVACQARASLGLDDERARRDMDELRELLSAWRDAKRSAWRAVVTWAVRLMLAMLLIGIAVRLRLTATRMRFFSSQPVARCALAPPPLALLVKFSSTGGSR